MRRASAWLGLVLSLLVLVAPVIAHARAGSGSSMGSRGSQTYSAPPGTGSAPYGASPFQQSTTVPSGTSGSAYSGYGRSGLGAGLLGGLLGFGVGSMFGHHYGYGFGYGGLGIIGFLIRLAIIFFVVRWLFRMFFRRRSGFAPGYATASPSYGVPQPAPPLLGPPVAVQPADYAAFEVLLKNIQAAWSNNDLNALRQFATPEMVSYFADQLAGYASRSVRNVVSDVRLQQGDLSEAWQESGRVYATVSMRFSMIDATYDQAGRVVDGSASEHVSSTEFWTFVKAPGGHWILSATQQAR